VLSHQVARALKRSENVGLKKRFNKKVKSLATLLNSLTTLLNSLVTLYRVTNEFNRVVNDQFPRGCSHRLVVSDQFPRGCSHSLKLLEHGHLCSMGYRVPRIS
jgi:hypothetical protein